LKPKSGYRFGCARRGRGNSSTDFSVKEKDEASPMNCFHRDSSDAFIPRFAGIGGFFILAFNFALVSQS